MHNRFLLIIVIISLALGSSLMTRGHNWGDDFAWYILQAKSIVDGTIDEFKETSAFTNTESTTHVGPLAYPWGYPLILVPAYLVRGIHPLVLKIPNLFVYAVFLVCLFRFMKTRLTQTESLLITALFAFNLVLLQFLDQILSDIPFLLFSTLSLYLMVRDEKHSLLQYALIGAAIFLTAFLRATGVLLLGCFWLVEFFRLLQQRRNWPRVKEIVLGSFVTGFTFVVLWVINALLFPSGEESYLSQYAGLSVESVRSFADAYFKVFATFFGDGTNWLYFYYGLVIFFLVGVYRRWREDLLFLLFFGFWMVVHITYPYWQGPRYIFPVLPLFIYFTFAGMKFVLEKLAAARVFVGQGVLYGFWSVLILVFLFRSGASAHANLQSDRAINGPFDSQSKEVYKYIQEQTPVESVVVFFKPRVMKLMTDRDSIMSTECDRILKGDYLVLSRKVGENQQIPPEEIDTCHLPLNQVLKNNRFVVYEIQK